ncbi:MAG: HAD family hydrolase [Acutalibacteraceae bacterium]
MLPLCTHSTSEGIRPMMEQDRSNILNCCMKLSEQALRVLGFAKRNIDELPENDSEDLEWNLTFLGVAGMIDPPRKEVAESVRVCREAGIRTVMITGDHKVTAFAIAKELGICQEGDSVISGEELNHMDDETLDAKVKTAAVFARDSCG